jgi:hypothetical protein
MIKKKFETPICPHDLHALKAGSGEGQTAGNRWLPHTTFIPTFLNRRNNLIIPIMNDSIIIMRGNKMKKALQVYPALWGRNGSKH